MNWDGGIVTIDILFGRVQKIEFEQFSITRLESSYELRFINSKGEPENFAHSDLGYLLVQDDFMTLLIPKILRENLRVAMNSTPVNWDYLRQFFPKTKFEWVFTFGASHNAAVPPGCFFLTSLGNYQAVLVAVLPPRPDAARGEDVRYADRRECRLGKAIPFTM